MKNTSRTLTIALLVLFGFLTIFYATKYYQLKKEKELFVEENEELSDSYKELNDEFILLQEEFKDLEDSTLVLNNELESKREELLQQKDELARIIKKGNLSKSQLEDARLTIASLRSDKSVLSQQIEQLQQENYALREENKNYSITLTDVSKQKRDLEEQNVAISTEKQQLEEEKEQLVTKQKEDAPKVEYGQVVKVNSVSSEGVRYRNSGKEVGTKNNKRVEKIKVNFTTDVNPVAPHGNLEYVVRIISPEGTVIYDEQRGSGTFKGSDSNEGMKYTTKTSVDYEGQPKNVSLFWRQDYEYPEGNYHVEVYNRGFLVGQSGFSLR